MRIRPVLALMILASSAASGCFLFESKRPENILVIAVDGLRFDALRTSLGSPKTPNMQRLEGGGVSFSSCFSASSAALPAHAALLSGRIPSSSRVLVDAQKIDSSVPLIQQTLQNAGWQTFADFSSPALRPVSKNSGLDRGFHLCRTHDGIAPSAAEVNTRVIPFLERASPDVPWFAFVQYSDPTAPYDAHGTVDRSAQILLDGKVVDSVRTSDATGWTHAVHVGKGAHKLEFRSQDEFVVEDFACRAGGTDVDLKFDRGAPDTPSKQVAVSFVAPSVSDTEIEISAFLHDVPDLSETRVRYKLEVEAVDRAVGDLLAALEKNGQYDRTCIVLVAPHGEALGEHGLIGHDSNLYDEVLRVPLVFKTQLDEPKRAKLGKHCLDLVRLIDVAPTLLDLVGEDALPGAEGSSLLRDGERTVMAEVCPPDAPSTFDAIRDDRYKLIYVARDDRFEMFNVKSDTLELENVFSLQGHFRSEWQTKLRDIAEDAAHTADVKSGKIAQALTGKKSRP